MAPKVDLTWKDSILVSLYDDLALMDLPNVIIFRNKTNFLLSTLELVFKLPSKPRTIQFSEDDINLTDVTDVRGAAHADITNMRFLLQGQPKDTANAQLRYLKTHAQSCVEKSPKKLMLRFNRVESPNSPSPWPRPESDINTSPTPRIELKPRGGNVSNVSSRLTSLKRKMETQKLRPAGGSASESNNNSNSDAGKQYPEVDAGGAGSGSPFSGFPDLNFGEKTPFSASSTSKGKEKKPKDKKIKERKHKNIFSPRKSAATNLFSTGNTFNKKTYFNSPRISGPSKTENLLTSNSPPKRSPKFKVVQSGKKRKQRGFERQISPLKRAKKQGDGSYDDTPDMVMNKDSLLLGGP